MQNKIKSVPSLPLFIFDVLRAHKQAKTADLRASYLMPPLLIEMYRNNKIIIRYQALELPILYYWLILKNINSKCRSTIFVISKPILIKMSL